jgi:hypothetical protein
MPLLTACLCRSNESDPIEQLLLVRDETANMACGVEHIVQGASGAPVDRASVPPAPAASSDVTSPVLRYQLGTSVPDSYIHVIPHRLTQ